MPSRASFGGHPTHPMLIPFPIGLLVFSFIADLTALIPSVPLLPVLLSIVGVIGLSIAGWLGGQLVFRHGVAVDVKSPTASEEPEARRHIRAA